MTRRLVVMVLCGALAACGMGESDGDDDRLAAATPATIACGDAERNDVDWSNQTSDAEKICSGPWERGDACCNFGQQGSVACAHAHGLATVTLSYAQTGTETCYKECTAYSGTNCNVPFAASLAVCRCSRWETICSAEYPPCSMAQQGGAQAQALLGQVNAARSGCVVKDVNGVALPAPAPAIVAMSSLNGGATCRVTISNAPVGHDGTLNRCTTDTHNKVCAWDPATTRFDRCTSVGSGNLDGTLQTWVDSTQCPALPKIYEPAGRSLAQFKALDARLRVNARCLTGEDVSPLGTTVNSAAVQSKYDWLVAMLANPPPANPEGTALSAKVAKHLKYLVEFHGDKLTDAQLQTVGPKVYQGYPEAPTCGSQLDTGMLGADTTPATLRAAGDLLLCRRLNDPHARRAAFLDRMALYCADATGQAETGLGSWPTALSYTEALSTAAVDVMKTGFGSIDPALSTEALRLPVLQRRLWTLGRWYETAKAGVYAADPGGAKRWADTSGVVGAIWEGVHLKDRSALDGDSNPLTTPEAELENYLKASFQSDAELVRALFTNYLPPKDATVAAPPLRSGPALMFVADGFRAMTERLDALTPFHDFGCQFLDCAASTVPGRVKSETKTEMSSIYRLLGSLHDKAALDAALLDADQAALNTAFFAPARWTPWRSLFGVVSQGHAAVVQPAIQELLGADAPASYSPAWVTRSPLGAPKALIDLSTTVRHAGEQYDNYKALGQFRHPVGNVLPTGLLATKLQAIQDQVAWGGEDLSRKVAEYRGQVRDLVASRLAEIDFNGTERELTDRKDLLYQQIFNLASDDAGLKATASIDQARFGDLVARITEVMATLEVEGANYSSETLVQFAPISGNAARWTAGAADARTIGVQGLTAAGSLLAQGVAGDILQLDVSGEWSPTCALQAQNGSFYGMALDAPDQLRAAKTTSDGFSLSYSGGSFHAKSHTVTTSKTFSASAEVCAGGGVFVVSARACAGYSTARTTADSSSSGSDARASAAFAEGLRLPQTPFKDFPAGSLVAVQVDHNTGVMIDAVVVQSPRTAITFAQSADVYLVVNDQACGNAGPGSLNLSAVLLRPSGRKAMALAAAMSNVWAAMGPRIEAIVQQGRLLPDDSTGFRNLAWQELRTRCTAELAEPCEPSDYPPVLYGFFQTWIDAKILHVEREIEHLRIQRELDQLLRQSESVVADIDAAARKGRFVKLMPYWTLQNLNLTNASMRVGVDNYMTTIRESLLPMVRLRYPEALQGISGAEGMLHLDWYTIDISTLANAAKSLGDSLSWNLRNAVNTSLSASGDATVATAILRFPNPANPPLPDAYGVPGRTITDGRAQRLWEAIQARRPVSFAVTPEDLYASGTTNTLLSCDLVAPSVSQMAFYVSTGNPAAATRNGWDVKATTYAGRNMVFPTGSGLELFAFGNDDFLTAHTKLLYGVEGDAQFVFDHTSATSLAQGPQGISPVNTWILDPLVETTTLVNAGDPYGDATEFLVVMRVEARSKAAGVNGVETCPSR